MSDVVDIPVLISAVADVDVNISSVVVVMSDVVDIKFLISVAAVVEVNISSIVTSAVVDPIFNINSCSCRSQHQ